MANTDNSTDGSIIPRLPPEQTQELLHLAIESIADGFAIYDEKERLIVCNSSYRALVQGADDYVVLGATFEEMHRKALAKGYFPEAAGREDEWIAQLLDEHRNPQGPREHQLSDGRCMLVTKRRTPNGWTASLRVDVTALRNAQAEANRTREHLAAIVDTSGDAIISTTLNGTVTSWNKAAERIFGYAAEEIMGHPIARLSAPGSESEMAGIFGRIELGERVEQHETRRRRKDGAILDIALTESPIYDERGRLIGISSVSRDVTASKAAEATARLAEARLQELHTELLHVSRLSAMGQTVAMISHELNQPLAAIRNYVNAAKASLGRDGEAPVRLQDILGRASEQASRASQIIQRLRGFLSRGETEKQIELVSPLVKEAAELAAVGSKHLDVDIEIDDRAGSTAVLADKVQLQQVLLNLLRNAAEAVGGQERRQIGIVTEAAEDAIDIAVIDNGPGLPQEVTERLFQPFVSTKKTGMGVGLSLCKSIVEAHDGRIKTEANPDGGTIFRTTLPIAMDACLAR